MSCQGCDFSVTQSQNAHPSMDSVHSRSPDCSSGSLVMGASQGTRRDPRWTDSPSVTGPPTQPGTRFKSSAGVPSMEPTRGSLGQSDLGACTCAMSHASPCPRNAAWGSSLQPARGKWDRWVTPGMAAGSPGVSMWQCRHLFNPAGKARSQKDKKAVPAFLIGAQGVHFC